jgi:hypothetical protein
VIEITPLYTAAPVAVPVDASNRKLSVWYGSMPESNGKTNWTAILHAGDIAEGITLDRSEYPDCVRYEADRARYLIGEIDKAPFILDYDADKHSGYSAPAPHSGEAAISDDSARIQDYAEQNMLTLEEAADELRSAPRHDRVPAIGEAGGVVAEPAFWADDEQMAEWYAGKRGAIDIRVVSIRLGSCNTPLFAAQPQAAPIIDTDAATRLRGLCSDLGVPACSVPQGDAELLACLFSLLGSIRFRVRELKAAPSGLSDAQMVYPEEITKALRHVLSKMCFEFISICQLFRASGVEIDTRAEAEQAYCLHWLIKLVLKHGDEWATIADAELKQLAEARKIAAAKATGSGA